MNTKLESLDLLDLISERHIELRGIAQDLWNESSSISLSNSEWFILARIYESEKPTISYVSKRVDISRQAAHKLIRRLEEKGLVEIFDLEHNRKEKGLQLTRLGQECLEKNASLKAELESRIAAKIGEEQLKSLKDVLKLDWGL